MITAWIPLRWKFLIPQLVAIAAVGLGAYLYLPNAIDQVRRELLRQQTQFSGIQLAHEVSHMLLGGATSGLSGFAAWDRSLVRGVWLVFEDERYRAWESPTQFPFNEEESTLLGLNDASVGELLQDVHHSGLYASAHSLGPKAGGAVVILVSTAQLDALAAADRRLSLFVSIVVTLLLSSIGLFITSRLLGPLNTLRVAAQSVTSGQFETSVTIRTRDELETLGYAFNEMNGRIRTMIHELQDERNQAQAAARSKGAFLANMSHELRTPLNGVIGLSDLLRTTELNAEQQEYADAISSSASSLVTIIGDVLDFSKAEANQIELEAIAFDPRTIVHDVAMTMFATARAQGVEIIPWCSEGLPERMQGDPARLRQVVTNLVGNAVKFTAGGYVLIRARMNDDSSQLRIAVEDTGEGIPAESLEAIFQTFTQADSSTTRRFGGTGLGLAISRQIVELMGGQIGVQSVEGEGSTFEFHVPATVLPAAEKDPRQDLCETTVLVVAEHPMMREMLNEYVLALKGTPLVFPYAAATETTKGFDLCIVDEGVSAEEVTELGRRTTGASLPPVLQLRSAGGVASPPTAEVGVISKPLSLAKLRSALRNQAKNSGVKPSPLPSDEASPIEGARILVAEDNKVNQLLVQKFLEKLGCWVEIVPNGEDAIRRVAAKSFDLVLMDCQMPVKDGYEATRAIRASGQIGQRIPIVALTANTSEADRQKCLESGMNDFVAKPFKRPDMVRVLDQWINKSRASSKQASPEETHASG